MAFPAPDADAHARRWALRLTRSFNWVLFSYPRGKLMKESAEHHTTASSLVSRHGRNTCWFICAARGLKIYNSEWQLRCSELTRLSALPILDLRTEEETGGVDRWRLDTSYRSWSWRKRLRSVHWRTLWDPSLISRNTAAHLGRAELSTGKTRVTLTLLCDPDSM